MTFRRSIAMLAALALFLSTATFTTAEETDTREGDTGTGTFTVNLVTCEGPGSVSSISWNAEFDINGSEWDCRASWDVGALTLNGEVPDGGDGVTSVSWSGLDTADTYLLVEEAGIGWFGDGYTLTFADGETDVSIVAMFYDHFNPDFVDADGNPAGVFTLTLVECTGPGSANSLAIYDEYALEAEGRVFTCETGWNEEHTSFAVDGHAPDRVDGPSLIWTGMDLNETHVVIDSYGNPTYDGDTPYATPFEVSFAEGEMHRSGFAVFYDAYIPTDEGADTGAGEGDADALGDAGASDDADAGTSQEDGDTGEAASGTDYGVDAGGTSGAEDVAEGGEEATVASVTTLPATGAGTAPTGFAIMVALGMVAAGLALGGPASNSLTTIPRHDRESATTVSYPRCRFFSFLCKNAQ